MAEYKCGDCFHAELCEKSEMLVGFSKNNYAYCSMFLNSADVAPVRYGRWLCGDYYDIGDVCSECDWDSQMTHPSYRYCPNCGARMDGSSNEE